MVRREVLEAAFDYISNVIQNSGSADIMVDVSNGTIPANYTGQFAVSKPVYTVANGYNQNHMLKHIINGTDPNVSNPDGTIELDCENVTVPLVVYIHQRSRVYWIG